MNPSTLNDTQSESGSIPISDRPVLSARKRWLFRLLSVLMGLCFVLGLEICCRLLGWGLPDPTDDPFVGFSSVSPLFERQGDIYEIAPSRQKFFASESFSVEKPETEFRIFILGGSTVQGRPYSIETTFGTWLEMALRTDDPSHDWEVINCGGISYASYRLVAILDECLTYQPDLIILCTGHNEFLEDRSYAHLKTNSRLQQSVKKLSARSHLIHLFRKFTSSGNHSAETNAGKPQLPEEVDAILDYHDSLKAYHRDDSWRDQIVEHYAFNLDRMITKMHEADVPLILVRPPQNLADSPPFKSEHSAELTDHQQNEIRELMELAHRSYRDDLNRSIQSLEKVVELDPRFALAWFELGQCYLTRHRVDEAREAFLKARDEDICPLRMISELETALLKIADERKVPLVDISQFFEAQSNSGLLDGQLLADHVHPTLFGHQLIAQLLQQELSTLRMTTLPTDSLNRDSVWSEYLQNLDHHYFLKGQETLKALRGWSQGRAQGPPAAERFPNRITAPKVYLTNELE